MSEYRSDSKRRTSNASTATRQGVQQRRTGSASAPVSARQRGANAAANSTARPRTASTSASVRTNAGNPQGQRKAQSASTQRRVTSSPAQRRNSPATRKTGQVGRTPPKKKRRNVFPVVMGVIFAALIIGAIVLTRKDEFSLRVVQVTGNVSYTTDEITQMAGLQLGDDIYSVSQDRVSRSLAQYDIKLEDMQVDYPGTVRLTVSERQSVAAVNCAGVILIIDAEGQIMERSTSVPEGSVVMVSGMDVAVSAQGSKIESAKAWQMADMTAVLTALKSQGMISTISELNVADRYNLYLVSRTGIKIILGDDELMDDKLVWAQTVLAELTSDGVKTGVLDVSTGKNAVYADR